jgi:hypothetical protein
MVLLTVLFGLLAVAVLNVLAGAGVCFVMVGHHELPNDCQYTRLKLANVHYMHVIPPNSPFSQCDYISSMTYTGVTNPS